MALCLFDPREVNEDNMVFRNISAEFLEEPIMLVRATALQPLRYIACTVLVVMQRVTCSPVPVAARRPLAHWKTSSQIPA